MRPVLFVLAGVNGAGKSSLLSKALTQRGIGWFDPDAFARALLAEGGRTRREANAEAWTEGLRRLQAAIAAGDDHALETTLGGSTLPREIARAARTHDVHLWYCGLASPELHIERVRARVAAGGHPIDAAKIRERWVTAPLNLVELLPKLAALRVYDNSATAPPGSPIAVPRLLLDVRDGRVRQPSATDRRALAAVPAWARPIVEAALQGAGR